MAKDFLPVHGMELCTSTLMTACPSWAKLASVLQFSCSSQRSNCCNSLNYLQKPAETFLLY